MKTSVLRMWLRRERAREFVEVVDDFWRGWLKGIDRELPTTGPDGAPLPDDAELARGTFSNRPAPSMTVDHLQRMHDYLRAMADGTIRPPRYYGLEVRPVPPMILLPVDDE